MAKPLADGVQFPANDKGERSTSDAQKKIFAAVFRAVGDEATAKKVLEERNWRYKYNQYVLEHVKGSLKDPNAALTAATAGLKELHETFEFVRDGKTYTLKNAMEQITGTFHTGFIKGSKPKPDQELVVPYKGRQLRGEALVSQLKKWAQAGTIEPSAAEAIAMVATNKKWVDLSDRYFVLLGAGSAMGPFLALMELGANIIAVDLDRAPIWKRLITKARESCGTITFPLKRPQSEIKSDEELYENAGSNLITQAPEINNWLKTVYPDKNLTVGCYVYLDGEAHVKVALACDAIMKGMSESRKTALAFLCTPTDVHVIPDEAKGCACQLFQLWIEKSSSFAHQSSLFQIFGEQCAQTNPSQRRQGFFHRGRFGSRSRTQLRARKENATLESHRRQKYRMYHLLSHRSLHRHRLCCSQQTIRMGVRWNALFRAIGNI
jgi:hypothetical protein